MRMKGCFKLLLVLLLVLSMALSACSGLGTDGTETDTDADTKGNETSNGTVESDSGNGNVTGSPEECKHSQTDVVDAKPATCVSEGYSGDKVCKACGEVLEKGTVIDILAEHAWDEGVITKVPTCAVTGVKTFTCTVCHITNTETVDVTDCKNEYHFVGDEAHGLTCTVCFKTTNGEHTKSQLVSSSDATCFEGAYEIYHCADCDSDFKIYDSTKPALGHAWDLENPVVTPATCSSKGEQYFVCKNAGCTEKTETMVLEVALGAHNYALSERFDPTCYETGLECYQCLYCGDSYEVTVGRLEHSYEVSNVQGSTTFATCSECGHSVSSYDASKSDSASIKTDEIGMFQALEVKLQNASVEFPANLVSAFIYESSLNVNAGIVDSGVKDSIVSGMVSEENKAILEADNSVIYDFGLSAGGETISQFYNTGVEIKVPYTLSEGEDPMGIVIWYVDELGEIEEIRNVAFSDEDGDGAGEVQFTVSHFSFYAVAYKETPAMRCRRGVHDYTNEDLWKKVEPTCGFNGYTVKICRTCGHTAIDNFVAAKEHVFGEKITPTAACDRGLYAYQQCKNCNYIKNHEYIPAVGHKIANQATCDIGAVCSSCHKILIPAYGHNWSDWTIIKEATEEESGLKRRNCPFCGEIEEVKIPKLSDIEAWEIDSFSDIVDLVLRDALALNNGKISFKVVQGDQAMTCDVALNIEDESEIIEIKVSTPAGENEYCVYYKDGALVASDGESGGAVNIDQLPVVFSDFEEMFDFFKSAFAYYEAYISEGIEISGALLDEYIEVFGETVDAELKANGYEYTSKDFKAAFDSFKTVYVYLANKLGVSTVCEAPENAETPKAEDIHKVLEAFMEKTEANGNVTYTYDVSKIKTLINDIVKECDSVCEKKLSEVCFIAYGPAIKAHLPEVTDWNKLMEYLRSEFSGSIKVSTIIDKLLNFVESSEAMTKDELFDMLDKALAKVSGTAFDTEALAKEYGEKTIDQLLSEVYGGEMTASKLYDELNKYMTETKLGDVVVDTRYEDKFDPENGYHEMISIDVTYREKLAEIKKAMENILLKGNLSITLDAEGNIVDVKVSGAITDAEGNVMSPELSLTFDRNDVKIQIPDSVKKHFDVNVKFEYDDQGNLVILGVPSDAENLEIDLQGSLTVDLADCVVLDKKLTELYGFNVYVLKEEYWNREISVGDCVVGPDGKLYSYSRMSDGSYTNNVASVLSYKDLVADPSAYLPKDSDEHVGIYVCDGEEILIYQNIVGTFYKQNDVWMIATYISTGYFEDGIVYYDQLEGVEYASVFTEPKISSIDFDKYYLGELEYNGQKLTAGQIYLEGPEGNNLSLRVALIDEELYLIKIVGNHSFDQRIDITGELTDAPEYDRVSEWHSDYVFYINGEIVEGYTRASLYKLVPTFYAEYDGYYFDMSADHYGILGSLIRHTTPFVKANVSKLQTHTLPDGRPVYVSKIEGSVESDGTVYGYILVNGDWYVPAACEYRAGALDGIYYRQNNQRYSSDCAVKYESISVSSMVDIDDYITKAADGKITVSAKLFELVGKGIREFDDYALLTVSFGGENENYMYGNMLGMGLPEDFDPDEFVLVRKYIDWDNYFGTQGSEDSDNYSFTVDVNDDGSITINAESGTEIVFEFDFDMEKVDASDAVQHSPILSEQYGFDVYTSTSQTQHSDQYAFYNGKYYGLTSVRIATDYTPMSVKEIFKNAISIGNITYQYEELDESGASVGRIYRSELRFSSGGYGWASETIYLKIIDGQIYVLTGISEETDITLKYEGQVLFKDYINGLEFVEDSSDDYSDMYDANNVPMGRTSFAIMYGDEYIAHYSCYYLNDGKKNYVYIEDYEWKDVPRLKYPVTLPAGWKELNRVDETFADMAYQLVSGNYISIETNRYAFVGDSAVNIDVYTYSDESVYYYIGKSSYIIGVKTDNGWEYYSDYNYGSNGFEYINKIELDENAVVYRDEQIDYGDNPAYLFRLYDLSSVDVYEMSNGVKVYASAGTTDTCYARLAEDFNIQGYLVLQDDGSYLFKNGWYDIDFSASDLVGALKLYDLIKVDGIQATVSAEMLEKLAKYSEHVRITVKCYMDGYYDYLATVGYEEFASWFKS